jgi:solute carrier family 12 sodium/potassium/chloride transporter 2
VTILRLKDGLDYSKLMGEEDQTASTDVTLTHPSTVDLRGLPTSNMMHADSNLSLADLGKTDTVTPKNTINGIKNGQSLLNSMFAKKHASRVTDSTTSKEKVHHIPNFAMENMTLFRNKQNKGNIDVWWLYDDGGLTMLLPYIISTRQNWANCKLRVFALGTNKNEIEEEEKSMAFLLSKFRLNYSSLKIVSISDKPQESTIKFFNDMLEDFRTSEEVAENECKVTEAEIAALQDKTYRQLRIRELLLENSSDANLIVM